MVSFAASTVLPVSGRVQCLRCVRDLAALAPMLVMLPRLAPSQMRPENCSAQSQGDAQGDENALQMFMLPVGFGGGGASLSMEVG